MTTVLRQLARLFATPEPVPYEFRAERVDQAWDAVEATWAAAVAETLRR